MGSISQDCAKSYRTLRFLPSKTIQSVSVTHFLDIVVNTLVDELKTLNLHSDLQLCVNTV